MAFSIFITFQNLYGPFVYMHNHLQLYILFLPCDTGAAMFVDSLFKRRLCFSSSQIEARPGQVPSDSVEIIKAIDQMLKLRHTSCNSAFIHN